MEDTNTKLTENKSEEQLIEIQNDNEISKLQDSPRAWSVVAGSFLIHFFVLGLLYSFGIYQQYFLSDLPHLGNSAGIAIIGSLALGTLSLFGLVSGRLADRIGYKTTILIGGFIIFVSLILASFATELWHYVLTQGFLFGFGCSLSYFPAVSAPSYWFTKQRGLATGIAVSGSGIGGFSFSLIIQKLLDAFGIQWTLRITGLILLVAISGSAMLISLPAFKGKSRVSPPFPKQLLKDPVFIFLFLMALIGSFGYMVPVIFVPRYATEHLNLTSSQGALAVSLFNAASTVGRIFAGFFADRFFGRLNSFIGSFLTSGIAVVLLWSLSSSFEILILFNVVNGFLAGGIISLLPVVISDIFGLQALASIIGLFYMSSFVGNFAGSPLAGVIIELSTNSVGKINWIPAIIYSGGLEIFSSIFGFGAIILLKRKNKAVTTSTANI
ncbi:hypothetical protein HK099_000337 [Clydaea vesicula]|uniref:Major facilitator superfamily (MFS) profile domain-containing protein n=1 Tax=Clydaea vesicula TaxID=447962 RepID=A0AAD5TVF7_9FUNG|nr:hypothetical protein HK099_000337 [Clydaea vesicula]KAJ3377719.1 hypothetical protein HDU92_008035 [Lobulomyces angularis]